MAKVVIIGAGPCGLGAAWRFKELGFDDFLIFEASDHPGGLASSFVDEKGFTWDVGGHVQFSHYEDFDRVMDLALPDGWLHHERESWVWMEDRFIPYPFQNNLWRLPKDIRDRCLLELERAQAGEHPKPNNFGEWIDQSFGKGISEIFMRPYNFKVWGFPPERLSFQWVGERVATVDLKRVKENIRLERDEVSWGPNATFRFPKKGGTGSIWKSVSQLIGEEKIHYRRRIEKIDFKKKILKLSKGEDVHFETLLSTLPLTQLYSLSGMKFPGDLLWSNSHIVGIGLEGTPPPALKTKCWIYFPEAHLPFYRVTVFSNYSPANVPDSKRNWSLMCETSSSREKPIREESVVEATVEGLLQAKLISSKAEVVSKWSFVAKPGYPTPSLNRSQVLESAFEQLKNFGVYSRGRFGAWKYEVSNQDHTFMQGFEWADWLLKGTEELTAFHPNLANAPGKRPARPL